MNESSNETGCVKTEYQYFRTWTDKTKIILQTKPTFRASCITGDPRTDEALVAGGARNE